MNSHTEIAGPKLGTGMRGLATNAILLKTQIYKNLKVVRTLSKLKKINI